MRIAIVGSGISGLSAAWLLAREHQVTLFEADARLGGHTHTVDVTLEGRTHGVDTGFLVFNEATYPNLVPMLRMLGVPVSASEMSFSLSLDEPAIEWSGSSLATLFAQKSNLLRPDFLRMLRDILRFNREATRAASQEGGDARTLGAFLEEGRYSAAFRDWYLAPMAAAIWSCPTGVMLGFPFSSFARFFHNHGLLKLANRPPWFTVAGGARQYVERLAADLPDIRLSTPVRALERLPDGVRITSQAQGAAGGAGAQGTAVAAGALHTERFDTVVLACHSDQALRILGAGASAEERAVLGAIPYQHNRALLHTDAALLPARRAVWSAWNYSAGRDGPDGRPVSVHYLINRLQPLPFRTPVIVSLNPHREPRPETIIGEYDYEHPVFGASSREAQARLPALQGRTRTWFCGAWTRYGFHEDGLASAVEVARRFGIAAPWSQEGGHPASTAAPAVTPALRKAA